MDLVSRAVDAGGIHFLGIIAENGENLDTGSRDALSIAYLAWHVIVLSGLRTCANPINA